MRLALAVLLVALAPSSALAQAAEDLPPPPSDAPAPPSAAPHASLDVEEELGEPTAAPYLPSGYRRSSDEGGADRDTRTVVHVLSLGEDDLTLHARPRDSNESFRRLCTAPCTLRLEPGSYELAVSPSGGGPRMADDQPVALERGRAAIQMSYDHRSAWRVLGWTFFSIGATSLGLSIGLGALFGGWAPLIALISGAPITGATWIPFFFLAFLEDSARVQVTALDE